MRRPTRRFVVEVKSSRRRSTRRPASIWGDIDLKGAARDAEVEMSDARQSVPIAAAIPLKNSAPGSVSTEKIQIEEAAFPVDQTAGSPASAESQGLIVAAAIRDHDAQGVMAATPLRVADRAFHDRKPRRAAKKTVASETDEDGLVALMAENRRLKLLLREKMIRDNALLRQLLARYEPLSHK